MSKITTLWRRKGRTQATADYDGATIDYDEPTQKYAGNGETAVSVIKQRTAWDKKVKQITSFSHNPASEANDQVFDTARVYNVAATYDGIVVGEPHSTSKKPTAWSKQ